MGNLFSRKFDPLMDLVDLKGKVAIVTGGNTGIGYGTVKHLARAGAKVYLAARNESRADNAMKKLAQEGLHPGNGEVVWLKLDLSDPRDVKKVAEEFLAKESRLDILVNNAGMIRAPYIIGPDGVSTMAIVNYISPFIFTKALCPLLQQTAKETDSDVRIVNVTSIGHHLIPFSVKFDDIADFNVKYTWKPLPGFYRYAHSKFMITLWSRTLQRSLDASSFAPITVIAVHPGGVDTFTQNWPFPKISGWLVGLVIAQVDVGAYNSVFAAAGKRVKENKDLYHAACILSQPTGTISTPNRAALNDELGDKLWNATMEILDSIGLSFQS